MALVQKRPFFELLFQAIQAKELSFTIFQIEKTPFQPIKTTSLRSRKIYIFPKGLTHCFGPKMAIFRIFFFRQYRPGKCLLCYCRTYGFVPNLAFNLSIFLAIQARKMGFTMLQNKKGLCTRSPKVEKLRNGIFLSFS